MVDPLGRSSCYRGDDERQRDAKPELHAILPRSMTSEHVFDPELEDPRGARLRRDLAEVAGVEIDGIGVAAAAERRARVVQALVDALLEDDVRGDVTERHHGQPGTRASAENARHVPPRREDMQTAVRELRRLPR